MKMKLLIMMGLFSVMVLTGCSNDEDYGNEGNCTNVEELKELIQYNLIPEEFKAIENLPNWLAQYIHEIESYDAPSQTDEAFFQFEWNNQVMYFYKSPYTPMFFERIFYSDGEKVDLNEVDSIVKNSKNWKLIYRIQRNNI